MQKRTSPTAACVALWMAASPAAAEPIFGNKAGCAAHRVMTSAAEDGDATEEALLVTPEAVQLWESECDLPEAINHAGEPMIATCHGEGDVWTIEVALLNVFDGLTYVERRTIPLDDEAPDVFTRAEFLSECT